MVKSLYRSPRACSYYRADLHVHSPKSSDYLGDKKVSALEFVSAFVNRGFDLIAITDHNTGVFIDEAVEARDHIARTSGENIRILPGVELHVSPGVHLLAILAEGGSAEISDLLSRLGLLIHQHGDTTAFISQQIRDIAKEVHERGGLLIGAHCNSDKGILQKLSGKVRLDWLDTIDALEINSVTTDNSITKTIDYVRDELRVSIPFIFGSDSHDCTSNETGMWVKMAEPSLTCLRQLKYEPELRISRSEPIAPEHGRIVGFTTTHGIYEDERFRFSPHLNVLLGGRGAGKSAAIDLIRFAFEAEPRNGDEHNDVFANRIVGFLKSAGEVIVVAVGVDGETYIIIRSGAYETPRPRATPNFTDDARVYQVAGDNLIQRDIRPMDVLGIEFYGQGEVAQLADRVDEQLRLIDENLDHSADEVAIAETQDELSEDEDRLVEYKRRLGELQVEAAERPRLEERRNHLSASLADPIFAERTRWDRERTWLQRRQDSVKAVLSNSPESIPTHTDVSITIEKSSARAVLEKVLEASDKILENARADLQQFRAMITTAISELEGYRNEWDREFEVANARYRTRLAKLGVDNLHEVAAEQRSIEGKLTQIETITKPEIEQVESKINAIESRRPKLLEKLRAARAAIDTSRSDFVKKLNSKLGGDVKIELCGGDMSSYFDAIDTPLQGSGMQRRGDQLSLLCESFKPDEFVEIVRSASIEKLTEIGITENNASRLTKSLT